jgi:O-antigen/teichoic acid export membrane protein
LNTTRVIYSLIIKVFTQLSGFVSLFFIARYLGPEPLGIVAFGLSFIGMFEFLGDLGFGDAHIKRVSEGKDLAKCNGTFFTIKLILNLLFVLVVVGYIFVSKYIKQKPFISHEHEIVIYIFLIISFIGNINSFIELTFSARKEVAKASVAYLFGKISTDIMKIITALNRWSVIRLALTNLIGGIITIFISIFNFRSYPIGRFDSEIFKSYLRWAIPLVFVGFIQRFAGNLDRVMIQAFYSSTEVGYYTASFTIASMFIFFTSTVTLIAFPTISKYHSEGNLEGIRMLSAKMERFLSMMIMPFVAFIIVFSKEICLVILGPRFIDVSPTIFIILAFVVYINAITANYIIQISGTNHINLSAKLSILTLIINIGFNLIFIPEKILGISMFGLAGPGAAIATLVAAIVSAFAYRYFAHRITKSRTNKVLMKHALAGILLTCFFFIGSKLFIIHEWYYLMITGMVGSLVYLIVLGIFREFTKVDFLFVLNSINPLKLLNYAKNEIGQKYEE